MVQDKSIKFKFISCYFFQPTGIRKAVLHSFRNPHKGWYLGKTEIKSKSLHGASSDEFHKDARAGYGEKSQKAIEI